VFSTGFRDECGLMGVWNHAEAANFTYLGLYSQQHRGQEGAGVAAYDHPGGESTAFMRVHRGMGLVADVFSGFDFSRLPGRTAVGHVRYTTAGGNLACNVQPFVAELEHGSIAVAHNGNLVNADSLRSSLISQGSIFSSSSDTEVFLHLIARASSNAPMSERVRDAVRQARGAFSLIILCRDRLFAIRDPHGLRPLCIGRLGESYLFASETCAFDLLGAEYVRDVQPGEMVEIEAGSKLISHSPFPVTAPSPCIFEFVYFARPDSDVFERNVYPIRKRLGEELARECPVAADIVIPVPDSGVPAALGYAQASGIPFELGLIRNHYVGRTFIEPKQAIRDFGVKLKLNPIRELLSGKRVVVVDDSIVRGTTSRKLVQHLRRAGASEVHVRISAPPTTDPCYYGIDTPTKSELIGSTMTVEAICKFMEADSLGYLSVAGMYRAVGAPQDSFCDACFTGKYKAGVPDDFEGRPRGLQILE
jgi:amidophosphoribosyltransferase